MKTTRPRSRTQDLLPMVVLALGVAPFAVTACDLMKTKDSPDAGPAVTVTAPSAVAPPVDAGAPVATPSTPLPPQPGHPGGGGVRPRLPDGGLGPLPPMPSGLGIPSSLPSGWPPVPSGWPPVPSGFPTVLPSNLPPFPTVPAPPRDH